MQQAAIDNLFNRMADMKVAVVGDVMLDTYWWGRVDRISPEAPVPVVALKEKEYRIGGAGNVALNLVGLQAKTTLFSIIGDDRDADILIDLLNENQINTGYLVRSSKRITTNKTRVMSRNQQMMRLDSEITSDISDHESKELLEYFEHYVITEKPDVVIFEDYNKGVLSQQVIDRLLSICEKNDIITSVDPKKKNFFAYKGVTIFKPNLKEVYEGLNMAAEKIDLAFLQSIHQSLFERLANKISLITLSEKGMFYQEANHAELVESHIRNIADVSGAGDTVIAVASLVYAETKNIQLAAGIANIAGGLVCEEVGTAAINAQKLRAECLLLLP
ncbi:MAG: PfkB family carbohydrate kinase [Chitinophagaceae bacterium]|nr:PfkB family carbohydrate kinase [Chitinophagaceae bacterium]